MPISNTYYLNGSTLSTATTVSINPSMNVPAPDGWYSDGVIVRQQISGILGPPSPCPSCGTQSCSTTSALHTELGGQGVYIANVNVGASSGAVVIRLNTINAPEGILVEYNGNKYNKLSEVGSGIRQAPTTPDVLPTYIGNTATCNPAAGASYYLNEYIWDGLQYNLAPSAQTVNVAASQVFNTGNNSTGVMVIPKPPGGPDTMKVSVFGTCDPANFSIEIPCPERLEPYYSTAGYADPDLACNNSPNQIYYVAYVNGSGGNLDLYDYVFSDSTGLSPLPDGYYAAPIHLHQNFGNNKDVYHVVNGVIIGVHANQCPKPIMNIQTRNFYTGCTTGGIASANYEINWEPEPLYASNPISSGAISTSLTTLSPSVHNGVYTATVNATFASTISNCPALQIKIMFTSCGVTTNHIANFLPVGGQTYSTSFTFPMSQGCQPITLSMFLYAVPPCIVTGTCPQ